MKRCYRISILAMVLVAASAVGAPAAADPLADFDKAMEAVKVWDSGKDAGPLRKVEEVVMAVAKEPPPQKQREAVELRLVAALEASSSREGRSFICRQLRTIGTGRSVPTLEALLSDGELTHMARYALGRIADESAAVALRRAMGKTSGKVRVGIIDTLSRRGYAKAMGDFAKLLGSSDAAAAEAAALGMGRIGGAEAVVALQAARSKASGRLRKRVDDALMACAQKFLRDGKKSDAARIYKVFYSPKEPRHVRLGALRGLAAAQGAEAAPLIVQGIKSDDAQMRASAIAFMAMIKGSDATKAFVAMLPNLPPEGQELVIRSLGVRGETSAAGAIAGATKSEHASVRLAAIEALGSVGDTSAVSLLTQIAATAKGKDQQVARASLKQLSGDEIDATLIRAIGSGDTNVRVEVIHALVGRKTKSALGDLLKAAGDSDKTIRREAIRAVGSLAGENDLKTLVALVVGAKDADDRTAAEQALGTAFLAVADRRKRAAPLLAAFGSASGEAKPVLVRMLGRAATAESLAAVRTAMKDRNEAVRASAISTLAGWPDATPAKELLALARSVSDPTHKVIFLRGYVRMAGMSPDSTNMYIQAMALAKRADDKKLVLAGLGTAGSAEAMATAEKCLGDKQVQAEAGLAIVQIAAKLRSFDAVRAKAALKNVIATVENATVRKKAQEVINDMEKYQGYVLTWVASGPYTQKGKDGAALFDVAFPPEKGDKNVKWERVTKGLDAWGIDLEATFGSLDNCACYLRTSVFSPADQEARLEMGSDDGILVWLNGEKVHANNANRGLAAGQDVVKVKLKKGWNVLMAKVVDNSGGWAFCCRIRSTEGTAIEGLKVEAK